MSYNYDRSKTAASMDFREEWKDILDRHEDAMNADFMALLKKAVPYLKSVGYDLIVTKCYLGKEHHGSDGWRMSGEIVVKEREENTFQADDGRKVSEWIQRALGISGYARKIQEGPDKDRYGEPLKTWSVDISES